MEAGKLIRRLRLERGLTQQHVADKLSISRNAYIAWESNRVKITLGKLHALCALFDISVAEFFVSDGTTTTQAPQTPPDHKQFILEKLICLKEENERLIKMNKKLIRIIKQVSSKGLLFNLSQADFYNGTN